MCDSYKKINSRTDLTDLGKDIANVLFIHKSRLDETPYKTDVDMEIRESIDWTDFREVSENHWETKRIKLDSGRYFFDFQFLVKIPNKEIKIGVKDSQGIFRTLYCDDINHFAASYTQWIFDIPHESEICIFLENCDKTLTQSIAELSQGILWKIKNIQLPIWAQLALK
jgi:hypothetical protein